MATLLFDLLHAQPDRGTKFHGGGEYTKTVFHALLNRPARTFQLEVCYHPGRFLDDWIKQAIEAQGIRSIPVESARGILQIVREHPDRRELIFYSGLINKFYDTPFPEEVRTIGTFHGLRNLEKPFDRDALQYADTPRAWADCFIRLLAERFGTNILRARYEKLFDNFDTVVTVSRHSLYSMYVNFPALRNAEPEKLKVLYSPLKHSEAPYILMVSANRWLKNAWRGVRVLDSLYSAGQLGGIQTKVYGNLPAKILMIAALVGIGIGQGVQPLLGFCYGSKNRKRFGGVLKCSLIISFILCTAVTALCALFIRPLVTVFLTDHEALDYGVTFSLIMLSTSWFFGVYYVLMNTVQAIGAATPAFILSLCRQGLVYIPAVFILDALIGMNGIAWAQPVADTLSLILTVILCLHTLKKIRWEKA